MDLKSPSLRHIITKHSEVKDKEKTLKAPREANHRCKAFSIRLPVDQGAWVAQSVKHLTSAQVMISRFMGSSPASGSVLTAQSLEPASDSVFPSLSPPTPLTLCLSLSFKNK